jgi:[ribosomal protein S5]-alanine N-acetyltransferase
MIDTPRLSLRPFGSADAAFVVELLNDADWIRFIGDRQVRTLADAQAYIEKGPAAMQARAGFSLWRVAQRSSDTPLGMCGLIRREGLQDIDLGFAFLARHRGQGFATEAAQAVIDYADTMLMLARVVAICDPDNAPSIRLLEKLGFTFEKFVQLPKDELPLKLFSRPRPTPNA